MDLLWKSVLLITAAIFLLRITGRKSISQMTMPTTIVMISVGAVIVEPIIEKSVWKTVAVIAIFVSSILGFEYLQIKWNWFEKLFTGKSITMIEDGKLQVKNIKKARLTVDQLEILLRQQGIEKITDVKTATLEPNGQLGYQLMPDAKPVTVGDLKKLYQALSISPTIPSQQSSLFHEVRQKHPSPPHPTQLQ